MIKKYSVVLLFILIISFLVPLSVSACGGFVGVKGEKIFHSVYCDEIAFENMDKMRWFDTAEKAERSGLKMCEICADYYDWYYDPEFCDYYWFTDDPLIMTAMELSLEYGQVQGEENAAEEYNWYYESGFEDGYNKGFEDGTYESNSKLENKQEQIKNNRNGTIFTIAIIICIPAAFNYIDVQTRKRK